MDDISRRKLPQHRAGLGIDGVDVAVAAAKINFAIHYRRGGNPDVPCVGNGLGCGRISVQILGFELSLELSGEYPFRFAGGGIDRSQRAR